jgi:hypothetical protein
MLCCFKMANKYGVGFKKHKLVKSIRKKKNVISQKKKVQTEIEELIGTGRRNMKINHRPKLEKYTINNDMLYSIIYCKLVNIHIHIHIHTIYVYI